MPCNYTDFFDPLVAAKYGIVDFDWSNAKGQWTASKPMDCEERLLRQAEMVKAINPETKVYVYRNLVKALPWYRNVRSKLTESRYSGWFLKFKPGGSLPNGSYHVPRCTTSVMGGATKCSNHYHDQKQTPQPVAPGPLPPPPVHGWGILEPGKIPQPSPDNISVWSVYQKLHTDTYQECAAAAQEMAAGIASARFFTWWGHDESPSRTSNVTVYRCWLSSPVGWSKGYAPTTSAVHGLVSGFRGVPRPVPPVAWGDGACLGDCDCGDGLPCGEYLWDHRNESLRQYLVDEVVLSNLTGLGNKNIDGFYFDDAWSDKHDPPPRGQPATYRACDSSHIGGATEEDANCVADMGLAQADTIDMVAALAKTMTRVNAAIVGHGGFSTRMMPAYAVHAIDDPVLDPRPPVKCNAFMRRYCRHDNENLNQTFTYEWTRKSMHDISPIPAVTQDLARFLLVRGPYAYIGWQWVGCRDSYERPPELELDFGTPIDAVCHETSSGVFERKWTSGMVRMDCNTWSATLPHQ
jgi:hypothetical protein